MATREAAMQIIPGGEWRNVCIQITQDSNTCSVPRPRPAGHCTLVVGGFSTAC